MEVMEQKSERVNDFEKEVRQNFNDGKYDEALEMCQKFLDAAKEAKDKNMEALALRQYAMVHSGMGKFEEGLRCCRESLLLFKEEEDQDGIANSLFNMGNIHYMLDDIKAALIQYNEALNIFHEIQNQKGWALVAHQLGRIYHGLKEWDQAVTYYQKALDIFRKLDQKDFLAKALGGLGQIYAQMGKMELGFDFSVAALTLCLEINDPTLKLAARDLYEIFLRVGADDFKELWESTVRGITLGEMMEIFSEITSAEEDTAEQSKKC